MIIIIITIIIITIKKNKLLEKTAKVDKVLSKLKTHSIAKTNKLLYAGAVVVTNRLWVKIDKVAGRKEPMWNRKFQNKIKELRKDLSQVEVSKDISNFRNWEILERKYSIRVKRQNVVIKELKQRITAVIAKVGRHQGRADSYRQNRLFENNRGQFYRELDKEKERCENSFVKTYGVSLQIIRRIQSDYNTCEVKLMLKKQEKIDITQRILKKILGRMPNQKSPGPDLVQVKEFQQFA